MSLEDIQKHIEQMMAEQNSRPVQEFEGYSPAEMHQLLHFTFEKDSPVKLQKLSESDYKKIPILNQIKYLMELIDKNEEIKLTTKGFLTTKIVSDIYQQGFLKDELIEKGISKLYKETDSMTVHLTKILVELAGLTKKRNGKLSSTKASKAIIENNHDLLKLILLTFTEKFNWAYFDGYGDNQIGQLGYGFSLVLLSKYGQQKRLDSFYAEKYFTAYPKLLESVESDYDTQENNATRCYSVRTFNRFLDYFGLITLDHTEKGLNSKKYVVKTDLYDKLIKCMPPSAK